jgi:hypothetical protein
MFFPKKRKPCDPVAEVLCHAPTPCLEPFDPVHRLLSPCDAPLAEHPNHFQLVQLRVFPNGGQLPPAKAEQWYFRELLKDCRAMLTRSCAGDITLTK